MARRAAKEGWSVRDLERRVARGDKKSKRQGKNKSPVVRALEEALEDQLMTRVEVQERRGGKGTIEIKYHSPEDFERLFAIITGRSVGTVVG